MISSVQGVGSIVIQTATESLNVNLRKSEDSQNSSIAEYSSAEKDNVSKGSTIVKSQGRDTVELSKVADQLRDIFGKDSDFGIEFTRDKATEKMVFKVIDNKTKEVVNQIPKEIELKIAKFVSKTLDDGDLANAKV